MPAAPVITSFVANVYLILKGQSVILTWNTNYALSCEINGVVVPTIGSKSYAPLVTTTYTLRALNEGGQTTKSLTIVVSGTLPPPTTPPTATYSLYLTTIPGGTRVVVDDVSSYLMPASGIRTFSGLLYGWHVFTVTKDGYAPYSTSINFTANVTRTITLTSMPVICKAGDEKCIGADLYRCNDAGTEWVLKEANSKTCTLAGAEPNFLLDPKGWIAWFFVTAWERITGFVGGAFKVLLQSLNDFTINFMAQLVLFIKDPLTYLKKALDGVYATILSVAKQISDGIGKWYDDNLKGTIDAIGEKLAGVRDWIGSGWDSLVKWWETKSAEVGKWIDDQAGILRRGWDATFAQWPTIIGDKLAAFEKWRTEFIDAQSVMRKDEDNILIKFIKEWFMEQITNYFNDALKGLNDEFDKMKKEEKK
jgi:hypothetical protein